MLLLPELLLLLLLTILLYKHLPLQLLWIFSFSTSQSGSMDYPVELLFAGVSLLLQPFLQLLNVTIVFHGLPL